MKLQGAHVMVADPQAIENARRRWPDLSFADTAEEAAIGADVILLATEWSEYWELDPEEWRAAGWTYRALGRR